MARQKPSWGGAVVKGIVRYSSVSALQTFDPETYGGCLRRGFFKYVEKRPEPQTAAQELGEQIHEGAEHYLKTGENVLCPEARAGQHLMPRPGSDLIIEAGFGDPKAAMAFREAAVAAGQENAPATLAAVRTLAGLSVAGIPLVGFIDVRHSRGEYVNDGGVVHKEDSKYGRVVEVIDHKSTSNLSYAKTAEDLVESLQMIGYANIKDVQDNADSVRLSHLYYQTRGAKAARKVTAVISVGKAWNKWQRVEALGRTIIDVVKATKAEDVDFNLGACKAYKTGCPHVKYCNRPDRGIGDLISIGTKGDSMSDSNGLFSTLGNTPLAGGGLFGAPTFAAGPSGGLPQLPVAPTVGGGLFGAAATAATVATPPAPTPPMSDAERAAQIADEKARLLGAGGLTPHGYAVAQACNGRGYYAGKSGGFVSVEAGHTCPVCVYANNHAPLPPMPVAPSIGSVNPPDAPPYDPVAAAAAIPPDVAAQIQDTQLRERAQAHAAASAAAAAAAAPPPLALTTAPEKPAKAPKPSPKTGGRCGAGGIVVTLTNLQASSERYTCQICGKVLKIKPSDDATKATLPGHNLVPLAEAPAAPTTALPPPPPFPIPATAAATVPPMSQTAPPPPPFPGIGTHPIGVAGSVPSFGAGIGTPPAPPPFPFGSTSVTMPSLEQVDSAVKRWESKNEAIQDAAASMFDREKLKREIIIEILDALSDAIGDISDNLFQANK